MRSILTIGLLSLMAAAFVACDEMKKEEDTPSRDHVLVLKNCLVQLQEAVLTRDRMAIDSLMAGELKSQDNAVDSLLYFVYGPGLDYPLVQFGNYDILYYEDRARIDCFIQDSSLTMDRPVEFTYLLTEDTLWYLKSFKVPEKPAIAEDTSDGDNGG